MFNLVSDVDRALREAAEEMELEREAGQDPLSDLSEADLENLMAREAEYDDMDVLERAPEDDEALAEMIARDIPEELEERDEEDDDIEERDAEDDEDVEERDAEDVSSF